MRRVMRRAHTAGEAWHECIEREQDRQGYAKRGADSDGRTSMPTTGEVLIIRKGAERLRAQRWSLRSCFKTSGDEHNGKAQSATEAKATMVLGRSRTHEVDRARAWGADLMTTHPVRLAHAREYAIVSADLTFISANGSMADTIATGRSFTGDDYYLVPSELAHRARSVMLRHFDDGSRTAVEACVAACSRVRDWLDIAANIDEEL